MTRRKPQPEPERRGRPAMKFNQELADQFGITPGADPPRELVQVSHIPTPTEAEQSFAESKTYIFEAKTEEMVANIIREEIGELGVRLGKFGVNLSSSQQQAIVDYTMSVLSGYGGGGAIARR